MSSYPAIEALEREGILFRRPTLRKPTTKAAAAVAAPHHGAKFAAARRLRDGLRDAVRAGLSPAELSALTRKYLKETS